VFSAGSISLTRRMDPNVGSLSEVFFSWDAYAGATAATAGSALAPGCHCEREESGIQDSASCKLARKVPSANRQPSPMRGDDVPAITYHVSGRFLTGTNRTHIIAKTPLRDAGQGCHLDKFGSWRGVSLVAGSRARRCFQHHRAYLSFTHYGDENSNVKT
jgi:hypothetical protein